jgi:hypothetical protein
MPTFLDYEQTQEDKDDAKENDELTTSCVNSEPSLHYASITPTENENIGNAHSATLAEGENFLDVLNSSTNYAIIEQLLVEPSLDSCFSQHDSLPIPCDKDKLYDNAYVVQMNNHAICVLKSNTYAESRHVIHIASTNDELKLLSSLNTLGYIEFDIFCNLNYLEDRLVQYADLPWFSRHTYHAISKYNNKG